MVLINDICGTLVSVDAVKGAAMLSGSERKGFGILPHYSILRSKSHYSCSFAFRENTLHTLFGLLLQIKDEKVVLSSRQCPIYYANIAKKIMEISSNCSSFLIPLVCSQQF